MKHTTRKTLGVLLALVMVLALLPATTVTAQAVPKTVNFSSDITVPDDIEFTVSKVTIENDITITIAKGKTLTVNSNVVVFGDKTLTIAGEGTLIINGASNDYSDSAVHGNLIIDGPTATIKSFDFANKYGVGGNGVRGNVTVKSGNVEILAGNGNGLGGYGGSGVAGSITVENGNVVITGGNGYWEGGAGVLDGTVTVNGGTVVINGGKGSDNSGETEGGIFPLTGGHGGYAAATVTVNGGTVTLTGGNGGNGGNGEGWGGEGGNGGKGVEGDTVVNGGTVVICGGNGGNGGHVNGQDCNGGNGGIGAKNIAVTSGSATVAGGKQGEGSQNGQLFSVAIEGDITGNIIQESDNGQNWVSVDGAKSEKQYVRVSDKAFAPTPAPVSHSDETPSASLTITSEIGTITRVTVDGKALSSADYAVFGSSVVLSDEFMRSLANGTHTIRLYDGETYATATWTVSGNTIASPKTADPGVVLYAALAVSATLGLGYMGKKRKED